MDPVSFGSILRIVVSLGLIVLLLLGTKRWAARGSGSARSLLRVVARVPLGRNTSVAIVELGDRHYLVGAGEQGVTLLDRLDAGTVPTANLSSGRAPRGDVVGGPAPEPVNPLITYNTDDSWPRTGLIGRLREMTVRAPGRARGDAFEI